MPEQLISTTSTQKKDRMSKSPWILHSTLAMLTMACGDGNHNESMDGNSKVPVESEELGQTEQAVEYNGHDYLFVVTPKNWDDAQAHCRQSGYDLVTINDASEENWLHSQENSRSTNHWWMGYTDRDFEGVVEVDLWIAVYLFKLVTWKPKQRQRPTALRHGQLGFRGQMGRRLLLDVVPVCL